MGGGERNILFLSLLSSGMTGKVGMAATAVVGFGVDSVSGVGVGTAISVGLAVAVGRDVSVGPGAVQVQPVIKTSVASKAPRERYFIASPFCLGPL